MEYRPSTVKTQRVSWRITRLGVSGICLVDALNGRASELDRAQDRLYLANGSSKLKYLIWVRAKEFFYDPGGLTSYRLPDTSPSARKDTVLQDSKA